MIKPELFGPLVPESSLVGEAFWQSQDWRLRLLAVCYPILLVTWLSVAGGIGHTSQNTG